MKVRIYGINCIDSEGGYHGRESETFTSVKRYEVEKRAYDSYKQLYEDALIEENVDHKMDTMDEFVEGIWNGGSTIQRYDSHVQFEGWETELEI